MDYVYWISCCIFVSCIDPKGDSDLIKTNESNSELFAAKQLNDTNVTGDTNQTRKTVKETVQSAPDTLWVMARDKQDGYLGSVFFEPDGRVWVSTKVVQQGWKFFMWNGRKN